MSHWLSLLVLLLLQLAPALCASTVEFFSSTNCAISIGKVNGTTDGVCHQSLANDASARVIELDQGCAATIYTDPFCSDSATIATLNICMSGNLIVGSFSIDCQATQSSAPAFTPNGPTPTSSPAAFSTPLTTSTQSSNSSIPQAAVIAAVAGASVVAVSLLPICYFVRRRHLQRKKKLSVQGDPRCRKGAAPKPTELAASEKAELPQSGASIDIPQLIIPKSSPLQRTAPMVSPLTPAPGRVMVNYDQQLSPLPLQSGRALNGNPTSPERQWYRDKTLPAIPSPQRPGSVAELGATEPPPQRSVSGASSSSAGTHFTKSDASSKTLHGGLGYF